MNKKARFGCPREEDNTKRRNGIITMFVLLIFLSPCLADTFDTNSSQIDGTLTTTNNYYQTFDGNEVKLLGYGLVLSPFILLVFVIIQIVDKRVDE